MKFPQNKKSYLLLAFLLISTFLIGLIFRGGVALTLMSFFTILTSIYILLKYLNERYPHPWLQGIQFLFRSILLMSGTLSMLILTLVAAPQFTCQTIPDESKEAKHIIVLGAGLWHGDQLSYSLRTRLEKAVEVLNQHPHLHVVVSGGQGPDEIISEAKAMRDYLIKYGISKEQIIMEDQSRSTYENLKFSQEKIASNDHAKVIVLTSDFHQFRANFIARRLGLDPIGICSSVFLSLKTVYMIREIPAVINDFMGNILK